MAHILALAFLIVFCVLVLVTLAICFLTPTLQKLPQPETKKKVFELACDGWLGRKMAEKNWAAFTYPLPFCVVIFYWVTQDFQKLDPYVRLHEFVHVKQDENNTFFLVSWFKYIAEIVSKFMKTKNLFEAYKQNSFEVEAYAYEDSVISGKEPTPDWIK